MIADVITAPDQVEERIVIAVGAPSSGLLARVEELPLVTEDDHEMACRYHEQLAQAEKEIRSDLEATREAAHATWKAAVANVQKYCGPFEAARKLLKERIAGYRRLRAEAEQRRHLAAASEAQKLAESQILDLAALLEREGDVSTAQALVDSPVFAPAVALSPKAPSHGVSVQQRWKAEVFDLKALLTFVLVNLETHGDLIAPVMPALNKLATAYRDRLDKVIPGVRAVPKDC